MQCLNGCASHRKIGAFGDSNDMRGNQLPWYWRESALGVILQPKSRFFEWQIAGRVHWGARPYCVQWTRLVSSWQKSLHLGNFLRLPLPNPPSGNRLPSSPWRWQSLQGNRIYDFKYRARVNLASISNHASVELQRVLGATTLLINAYD